MHFSRKQYMGQATCFAIFFIAFMLLSHITPKQTYDYGLIVIGTMLLLGLFQGFMGTPIFRKEFLVPISLALLWTVVSPTIITLSLHAPAEFKYALSAYAFGIFQIIFMVMAQYSLSQLTGLRRWINGIFSFFYTFLFAICSFDIYYFSKMGNILSIDSVNAIYETNYNEAVEYVMTHVSMVEFVLGIAFFFNLWLAIYKYNRSMYFYLLQCKGWSFKWAYIIFALVGFILCLANSYVPKLFVNIYTLHKITAQYGELHNKNYVDLNIDTNKVAYKKAPGTIIMVIGESANRDYMSVFNKGLSDKTTPWESSMYENHELLIFPHAYSCFVVTAKTLERALTERNQYKDKDFLHATSIVDVAKKAGYETYWISNQGLVGKADSTTSQVASTAKASYWTPRTFNYSDSHDGELLTYLKHIDPKRNNFIVVHIMGSHVDYKKRYPEGFNKFGEDTVEHKYMNTISYTDHFLKELFTYGKEHLNLQAMIYFSDHGEDMVYTHTADHFTFPMTRIPLWVYLSPTYIKEFPLTYEMLKKNHDAYWSNDLIYDLVVGILQAPNGNYNPQMDLSNGSYRFTKDDVMTFLGQHHITEDPEFSKY